MLRILPIIRQNDQRNVSSTKILLVIIDLQLRLFSGNKQYTDNAIYCIGDHPKISDNTYIRDLGDGFYIEGFKSMKYHHLFASICSPYHLFHTVRFAMCIPFTDHIAPPRRVHPLPGIWDMIFATYPLRSLLLVSIWTYTLILYIQERYGIGLLIFLLLYDGVWRTLFNNIFFFIFFF